MKRMYSSLYDLFHYLLYPQKYFLILCYHGIYDHCFNNLVPSQFVYFYDYLSQMRFLIEDGKYQILSLNQIFNKEIFDNKKRKIIITFDDGYENNKFLLKIFNKVGFYPVTIFVSTSFLDSSEFFPFDFIFLVKNLALDKKYSFDISMEDYLRLPRETLLYKIKNIQNIIHLRNIDLTSIMPLFQPITTETLKKLIENGIEIGSHSHEHLILSRENLSKKYNDLLMSKKIIFEKFGFSDIFFSYPNGQLDDFSLQDVNLVQKMFKGAVTGIYGYNNIELYHPFLLKRISIGRFHTFRKFKLEIYGMLPIIRYFKKIIQKR